MLDSELQLDHRIAFDRLLFTGIIYREIVVALR
jgi:hypothetical protein